MDLNNGDVTRRRLIASAIGSAAGLTAVVVAGSPAAAASQRQLGGVAEVVDTTAGQELLVRIRETGTKLRVQARDFGDMKVAKGDLVAVMPDFHATAQSERDALVAYPYLEVAPTGKVWSLDRTGEAHLVGTHA